MSEFREDLLATPINKKRVIKIILTVFILFAAFAFSTVFFNLLWDTQRPDPSDRLADAEDEDVILVLPPFPYNLTDFQDLFANQNLSLDEMMDLLDALEDMFDGDIDDLDLSNYTQALLALMGSEIEVFRVYDYEPASFNEMRTKLWKYESFDEYTGDGWHSSAAKQISDFYSYQDYKNNHFDKDNYTIRMPLSPNFGINSMVIPSLFPNPYIMENRIFTNPPDETSNHSLFRDDFNCTTLDFISAIQGDVNLTYELFGLDLPTGAEIDAMAIEPNYISPVIQNKYLQLKGDTLDVFISNNDDFAYHVNEINNTMTSSDNTFIIADKIRNYLQYNFMRITDPDQYNPAPDGYDQVEWFCEQGIGYWSDFTTAFCAFSRVFGVPSRFVNGFNSYTIEEFNDTSDDPYGRNAFKIKYKNMYTWAEVYIPTDMFGNGQWIQMDVYYDNYIGNPPSQADYMLVLNSNFTSGYRGNVANLTAILTLNGSAVEGRAINFVDLATFQNIGQRDTNINGIASILVDINDSQVVGPHNITAIFNPTVTDWINYTVYGDIEVNIQNVIPQEVNTSIDTMTNIQGFVYDPIANTNVGGTNLEVLLLYKGTNVQVPLWTSDWPYFIADPSGFFDIYINVDINAPVGQYDLRVDTNGTWFPWTPWEINTPINDSSNRMDFNITKGPIKKVWFYIDDVPAQVSDSPVANRYDDIILKAVALNETNYPLPNQNIQFYDFWSGIQIGSNTTDSNGIARYRYTVDTLMTTGPNLLSARLGTSENNSYFILNEEPIINILSGPTPRVINRTAIIGGVPNTFFYIEGELLDRTTGRPIRDSLVTLRLLQGGIDYYTNLMPIGDIWTDFDGHFYAGFEVNPTTPTGNYSLRLDFNGTIDYWLFNLPFINTSSTFSNELKVTTPTALTFNFWIDGFPYDNYDQPIISRNRDVNLSVYLESDGIPIGNGETIHFYDVTQGLPIGSAQTINGHASLLYSTNSSTVAGPHRISVRWGSNFNYSYFICNAPITINVDSGPTPKRIARSGPSNRNFNLHGFVTDSNNSLPIKFARIFIYMYDASWIDYTSYLTLESGFLRLAQNGEFDLTYSVISSTPDKNYTLIVAFDGWFMYSWPFFQENEHNFYLGGFSNFSDFDTGNFDLEVYDPYDLDILLAVEGNPTVPYYDNFYSPEIYNYSETAHFQVYVIHSSPVTGNTVRIYDHYSNILLDSYTYPTPNPFVVFNISTNVFRAGLNKIRVEYDIYATINTTYIIIDEPFTISAPPPLGTIQRNAESFSVSGLLNDGTYNMRFLMITIRMFDSSTDLDVTSLYLPQPHVIQVFNGNYQFDVNQIDISCPQGNYYIRIDFNGSIQVPFEVNLTDSLGHVSSPIIPITVTAGINIVGNTWYTDYDLIWPEFSDQWSVNDTIHILGSLEWDNGTIIPFMFVNVTVKLLDGTIVAFNDTVQTDAAGNFHARIFIDQDNLLWPRYRVDSEIWIYFDPIFNGLQYVTSTPYQFF